MTIYNSKFNFFKLIIILDHAMFSSWKCADCDAEKPTWASVNLAVLLCNDCASIHRDLGI